VRPRLQPQISTLTLSTDRVLDLPVCATDEKVEFAADEKVGFAADEKVKFAAGSQLGRETIGECAQPC
jgi:hypothetical protein